MLKVYSQLSLRREAVLKILPQASVAPPVGQDDVYRDLQNGARVIVIIDGRFHQNLPVTCGELMDALRCGVSIFGASSMGALRAAELDQFGMMGHGLIYEYIKKTPGFRDDLLGQAFNEDGSVTGLSIPFVDFYFNLKTLLDRGAVTRKNFDKLTRLYADIYYPERGWPTLRQRIFETFGRQKEQMASIAKRALLEMGSQKERDAIATLKFVKDYLRKVQLINSKLRASQGKHVRWK